MLMGHDVCFDRGFIANSMLRGGSSPSVAGTLGAPWGTADLDIGRKA